MGISKLTSYQEVKKFLAVGQWTAALRVYESRPDHVLATSLVSHANKTLGDLPLALSIYNTLKASPTCKPNCFLYTALVNACRRLGGGPYHMASLWCDIRHYRVEVDAQLYVTLLVACLEMNDLNTTASIISVIEKANLNLDIFLQTTLVKVYSKLGDSNKVSKIWKQMKGTTAADARFYCNMLTFCADSKELKLGRDVHQAIEEQGLPTKSQNDQLMITSSLVIMYSKCGCIDDALTVFNSAKNRDMICWNTMIQAYSQYGRVKEALTLLDQINSFGMVPDEYTYSIILKLLTETSNLAQGRIIHSRLKKQYTSDRDFPYTVATSLIFLYAKCGDLDQATQISLFFFYKQFF